MKNLLRSSVAVVCLAAAASAAHAETLEEDAARFGSLQSVLDVSLSPGGDKIAYIAPGKGDDELLYVVDLAGDRRARPIMNVDDSNTRLGDCDWATDERLVCQAYILTRDPAVGLLGFSRLFSVGVDGKKSVILSQHVGSRALSPMQNGGSVLALDLEGEPDRIVMTRQWVKEETTGTRLANSDEGLGVDQVDVTNGRRSKIEPPDADAVRYIADENGRVRIKIRHPENTSGYLGNRQLSYYRTADSDSWKSLAQSEVDAQSSTGFTPVAVSSALDVVYGFEEKGGYQALYSIALDGSEERKLVFGRDDADVDGLLRIGRQRRVVGVSYATEKRQVAYSDEYLGSLAAKFQAALPGKPLVNIVDASADEKELLIIASSDTDPGMVYYFEKDGMRLSELLPLRNELVGRKMGEMKPISFPAADGTMIPAYLTMPPDSTGKNMKAIVLPHGGPSARDEWGFDWLVQFFVARGYAVLQPNYRGSSGYGSDWFGRNGFKAWKTAIGDVDDAGRWLVSQGIADPEKLAIVGWSYGGYAALQSQVVDPQLYKAVVAIAPVTDLGMLAEESRNYVNYTLVKDFVGSGPHVSEGSPARHADRFAAPVLLFHGTDDQNVDVRESRLMKDRLDDAGKSVEYVEFDGRQHSIADTEARTAMLTKIGTFLQQAIGR